MKDSQSKQRKSLIFLTGFMGSGKSTIGPILANTLGFDYIDLDRLIEQRAQKQITEIFRTEGEQAFRTMEQNTLQELTGRNHCVISLGGGTIINELNYQIVSQNGILIYLKVSPGEILQRVQHRDDRPMLKDAQGNTLSPPELEKRISDLLGYREPFYSRADLIISADKMRVGATVDEIIKNLRGMVEKE